MSHVVRPYRGVSADDRRDQRRERLLDACLDVIGADGVAATTVGAICARAGLTKRYFYESFPERDAILAAVLDRLHLTLLDEIRAALPAVGDDPLARARRTIELLVAVMDDPRNARLYVEAPGHPVLQARREEAYVAYVDLVTADVLRIADPRAQDRLRALMYVTGTTQSVMSWLAGSVDLARGELVSELATLAVRLLRD